jgi:hypothetical protein
MLEQVSVSYRCVSDVERAQGALVDPAAGEAGPDRLAGFRFPEVALVELGTALEDLLDAGICLATSAYSPICLPRISFMISSVPPPIGPRRASRTARSIPYSRI